MNGLRPGGYEGTCAMRTRDRLSAARLAPARLQKDGRAMKATPGQSLVRGAPSPVPAARIVGAIGGAYAGHRIQNARATAKVYRVAAQIGGGRRNFDHAADPVLAVGARVKIADGAIVPR